MKKFLELLNIEDIEYEIQDGAVIVKDEFKSDELLYVNRISIPENSCFMNGLDLEWFCDEIQLPENLKVGHILNLSYTTITHLPSNLTIYDDCCVCLDVRKVKNVSYTANCGNNKRTIFAFWANDDFLIAAGCFTGNYSEFEQRVNEKYYDTDKATAYKRKARDCIRRLAKKLGKPDPFNKATAN